MGFTAQNVVFVYTSHLQNRLAEKSISLERLTGKHYRIHRLIIPVQGYQQNIRLEKIIVSFIHQEYFFNLKYMINHEEYEPLFTT